MFVSEAGGLRFKFRAGQIGHRDASGSPRLQYFLERRCVALRRDDAATGLANSLYASAYCSEYNQKI